MKNLFYIVAGAAFGIIMVKSEAVSWFRIQEMFRFQSFHMYGIIGAALAVGAMSVMLVKKFHIRNLEGTVMEFVPKPNYYRSGLIGGVIFGLGWAMTGACPGPLFVNMGAGYPVMGVVIGFAVLGAFVHGLIAHKLPR
ncbi:MAG: hypothetical protein RL266_1454 [Bacteroidota bacterium]|jgi:uncharacterized membrane protein YedE/YeeE